MAWQEYPPGTLRFFTPITAALYLLCTGEIRDFDEFQKRYGCYLQGLSYDYYVVVTGNSKTQVEENAVMFRLAHPELFSES